MQVQGKIVGRVKLDDVLYGWQIDATSAKVSAHEDR